MSWMLSYIYNNLVDDSAENADVIEIEQQSDILLIPQTHFH